MQSRANHLQSPWRQGATLPVAGVLQRKCSCGTHTGGGATCRACAERYRALQRKATNDHEPTEVPPIVYDVLRSPGQPLDAASRAFFEPRFGHDFSGVRVHTDAKAAESARAVTALAYTVERDVVFGSGRYAPGTEAGRRLLGHELAHIVQQAGTQPVAVALRLGRTDDGCEQEAEAMATRSAPDRFLRQLPMLSPAARGYLQRYRSKRSFNFGRQDTGTLKEEEFTNPKTQPWIERIDIAFHGSKSDRNGDLVPTGTLTAAYHKNPAALGDITFPITGGSVKVGLTDRGDFTVRRIEGVGYNDKPLPAAEGEGPRRKYPLCQ